MNKKAINAAVAKIREVLDEHPGGEPNETARRLVHTHANAIEKHCLDLQQNYYAGLTGDIHLIVDVYYSAKKWRRHKSDSADGVHVLRGRIDGFLDRIESHNRGEDVERLI